MDTKIAIRASLLGVTLGIGMAFVQNAPADWSPDRGICLPNPQGCLLDGSTDCWVNNQNGDCRN